MRKRLVVGGDVLFARQRDVGNVPGLVYFVRHDAAWSRREVVGGFELMCWRDGVELDRMVLDSARLDELFSRDD